MKTGPRVAHLIDPDFGGEAALWAAAAAQRVPGFQHRAWLIGGQAARHAARAAGLAIDREACAPLGLGELAARSVKRWMAEPGPRPDLLIAWSEAAMGLAGFAAPETSAIGVVCSSPQRTWRGVGAGWLQRHALARTPIICCGAGLIDSWAAIGAAAHREIPLPGRAPGRDDRDAVRAALGLERDEVAVLLLADPPDIGEPKRFAHLMGIMEVTGHPAVGLVGDAVGGWPRAARFVRRFGTDWPFIRFQGAWVDALAAADLVVWQTRAQPMVADAPRRGGAVLAMAALAAGVPVVAVDEPFTRATMAGLAAAPELLADGQVDHRLASVLRGWVADADRRSAFAAVARAFAAAQQAAFERAFATAVHECADVAAKVAADAARWPAPAAV